MTNTDNRIFTNLDGRKLTDRLNVLLNRAQLLDIMIGYFRITGFHMIKDKLENVKSIRILVGLGVDKKTYESTLLSQESLVLDNLRNEVIKEFNQSIDSKEIEDGVNYFVEWLKRGKIVIKMYPLKVVHAKLYIIKNDAEMAEIQYGNVITGSSNLSEAGLENNIEFNVELKDKSDVMYSELFFEELWKDSVDITKKMINIIESDTWLNNTVTPYEIYLKTLYEFFFEEIGENRISIYVPDGFMRLRYQEDAVIEAIKILEKHGGVLISDVVGLGKTYVAAMLGKTLKGRKLFIVPPVVKDTWEKVLVDFDYPRSDVVESLGMLDNLLNRDDIHNFDYIFIDEAHQFRNNESKKFTILKEICFNKKIILITATPHNNTMLDIAHLIELFQDPSHSSIVPNESNLDLYFRNLRSRLLVAKNQNNYPSELKSVSEEVRNNVLRHVMVRRTRNDIKKFYSDDIKNQGLKFPLTPDPITMVYSYEKQMEKNFNDTIELITQIKYARYAPLLYLNDEKVLNEKKSGQLNMIGFIKTMLVKRLESSIHAFKETIERINNLNDTYLSAYENDRLVVGQFTKNSKDYNVVSLSMMDDEQFQKLVLEADSRIYKKSEFRPEFIQDLKHDSIVFSKLRKMWATFDDKDDVKFDILKESLETIRKNYKKIIIFSEAKDTVDYLTKRLSNIFGSEVISYSGSDDDTKRLKVKQYFDPNNKFSNFDDINILVTTDALSEGINLHRANVIINYDLPWNPTRVMQRVGRINRVGTEHDVIYVRNFFPSTNAHDHLNLEENIKNKVLVFQSLLGSDAKLLTPEEEIETYGLFNSDAALVSDSNSTNLFEQIKEELKMPFEDNEVSFSSYKMEGLSLIRGIERKDKSLFERIKNLPTKIKVARKGENREVLTFMKQGLVMRFYSTKDLKNTIEVPYEYFIDRIKVEKNTPKSQLPSDYFVLMNQNVGAFKKDIKYLVEFNAKSIKLSQSQNALNNTIKFLRGNVVHEDQVQYLNQTLELIRKGTINKTLASSVNANLKGLSDIEKIIETIKESIPTIYYSRRKSYEVSDLSNEDRINVLSEYVIK